jgi:head-tail adaptor
VEPLRDEYRQAVRFERRALAADGFGNTLGDWQPLIPRRACSLKPTRGGEQTIAQRAQGTSTWDLWVDFDSQTAGVTTDDRVVDLAPTGRVFNIVFAEDMSGHGKTILMQLTLGKADG